MSIALLAHRGLWKSKKEKNTLGAFWKALDQGCGIETDLRDFNQKLVISHDPASPKSVPVKKIFAKLSKHPSFKKVLFAFNIKADGLQEWVKTLIEEFGLQNNSFVFDMSAPSHYGYSFCLPRKNIGTRWSDFESPPFFLEKSDYIWVDQFETFKSDIKKIKTWQDQGKRICFVSSDLHHRDPELLWQWLERFFLKSKKPVWLCTDLVEVAKKRFNVP